MFLCWYIFKIHYFLHRHTYINGRDFNHNHSFAFYYLPRSEGKNILQSIKQPGKIHTISLSVLFPFLLRYLPNCDYILQSLRL